MNISAKVKKVFAVCMASVISIMTSITAFANGTSQSNAIQKSKAYTGTMELLSDLCTALTAISFVSGVLCTVYFLVRRQSADEQDKKGWNSRAIAAVICTILIPLVTGTLAVIIGYYS